MRKKNLLSFKIRSKRTGHARRTDPTSLLSCVPQKKEMWGKKILRTYVHKRTFVRSSSRKDESHTPEKTSQRLKKCTVAIFSYYTWLEKMRALLLSSRPH